MIPSSLLSLPASLSLSSYVTLASAATDCERWGRMRHTLSSLRLQSGGAGARV